MPTPNDTMVVPAISFGIVPASTSVPARAIPQCPDAEDTQALVAYSPDHHEIWHRPMVSLTPPPSQAIQTTQTTQMPSNTLAAEPEEVNSSEDDHDVDGSESTGPDDHGSPATEGDTDTANGDGNLESKLNTPSVNAEVEISNILSPLMDVIQSIPAQKTTTPSRLHTTRQMTSDINISAYSKTSSMAYEYSAIRLFPSTTSSFLRPGSRFVGTQQSGQSTYDVDVVLKHVNMRESFLCGYLCIQNLTPENPELTTYFEAELIGPKHHFLTTRSEWGATPKIDAAHWARFPAFRPYTKSSRNPSHSFSFDQKEHIFMRWKECFLVSPNLGDEEAEGERKEKELSGASYEGFYYICFSQLTGMVTGYYFHANSEKWQQLELKHVDDRGQFCAMEFR